MTRREFYSMIGISGGLTMIVSYKLKIVVIFVGGFGRLVRR